MMFRGKEIAARTIALIAGIVLLIGAMSFGLYQCDQRRNEGAQSKVTGAQAGAQQESGADAINTVSAAGERERAADALTRENDREIRDAPGAGDRVNAGVNAAGLKALCRRDAYRNTERCKIFRKEPAQ